MTSTSAEPAAAPDWATMDRDVCCPLCDYNLRGLREPRCPECGHETSWEELLAELKRHPWLFEHQRRRKIRSLVKTFYHSQFPRRFWTAVKPTDEPKLSRLLIYWMIVVGLVFGAMNTRRILPIAHGYWRIYTLRNQMREISIKRPNDPWVKTMVTTYGSLQGYLDRFYTYPTLWEAWRDTGIPYIYRGAQSHYIALFVGIATWPWLTIATLQIFRRTLSRARIKFVHVARCAIYSADAGAVFVLLLAVLMQWRSMSDMTYARDTMVGGLVFEPITFSTLIAGFLLLTWRLWIAVRRYLRIPQPAATCIATQAIVALTLFTLYVVTMA